MSTLVENPEDRFSRDEDHLLSKYKVFVSYNRIISTIDRRHVSVKFDLKLGRLDCKKNFPQSVEIIFLHIHIAPFFIDLHVHYFILQLQTTRKTSDGFNDDFER